MIPIRPIYLFSLIAVYILFISYSANPPQGFTGAPGESTCNTPLCHSGNNILIQGELSVTGIPAAIQPSTTYSAIVSLRQTAGPMNRGGFQLTVVDDTESSSGILSNPGLQTAVSQFGNRMYAEHQPAQSFAGSDLIEYTVDWTTPADFSGGNITLYAAANFTNGNASRTGDRIITLVDTLYKSANLPLTASIDVVEKGCLTGENTLLAINISGGCPPYQTTWNRTITSDSLANAGPGEYTAVVRDCLGDSSHSVATIDTLRLPVIRTKDTLRVYPSGSMVDVRPLLEDECLNNFDVDLQPAAISCFDYPGISVRIQARDSTGLQNSKDIYVAIGDSIPPVLTCIQTTFNISTCAPFSYAQPQSTDNCGEVAVDLIEGLGVNASFPAGTTLNIYQAKDLAGNTSLCTVTVVNTLTVDLDVRVTDISCFGQGDGSVEVSAEGPNPPYRFGLDGTSEIPDSLAAGAYLLSVFDASGCLFNRTFVVEEPEELAVESIDVVHPTNNNSGNGSIVPRLTGGSPPYTYNWYTEDELFSSDPQLELLFPGSYLLEASDSRGCVVLSDTIQVEALTAVAEIDDDEIIQIWPNPFTDRFYISTNQPANKTTGISLIDASGATVRTFNRPEGAITCEYLQGGLYYVVVRMEKRKPLIKKVVKLGRL